MEKRALVKADGRKLLLYSSRPIPEGILPVGPDGPPTPKTAHLRWHPLREEWIIYAGHRQNRSFLPPADFDPLAPARPGAPPTEVPAGDFEVCVFENLFPSLAPSE